MPAHRLLRAVDVDGDGRRQQLRVDPVQLAHARLDGAGVGEVPVRASPRRVCPTAAAVHAKRASPRRGAASRGRTAPRPAYRRVWYSQRAGVWQYTTLAPAARTPCAQPLELHSDDVRVDTVAAERRRQQRERRAVMAAQHADAVDRHGDARDERRNSGNVVSGSYSAVWIGASGKARCMARTTRSAPPRWVR